MPKKVKRKILKKKFSIDKFTKYISGFKKYYPVLKKQKISTYVGFGFIILGLFLLYIAPEISLPSPKGAAESIVASREYKESEDKLQIVRIVLPKENIDLPVTPARLVKGVWEASEKGASQGEGTANPGTGGNVVVFAHAGEGMFYNLKDVKKGDSIYIFTKNSWYMYKVSQIQTVYPKNVKVVAPTKKEELTLFTCSGFFDEKRLIVKALPVK